MDHLPDYNKSFLDSKTGEFAQKLRDNFHHFVSLQNIIKAYGGVKYQTGSYMMNGRDLNYADVMFEKQEHLYEVSKGKTHIIETGVNAGHSIFIMMLANSVADFHVFDICMEYTQDCITYLQVCFPNLIHFYRGDSMMLYPIITRKLKVSGVKFDLVHLDGMHTENAVDLEIKCSLPLVDSGAILVLDDIDSPVIQNALNKNNELFETVKVAGCMYPNAVYKFK